MGEGVSAEARRRARQTEAGPKDHVRARRMLARIAGGGDSRARGRGRTWGATDAEEAMAAIVIEGDDARLIGRCAGMV